MDLFGGAEDPEMNCAKSVAGSKVAAFCINLLSTCIASIGCGQSDPANIPVSGRVTCENVPLSSGMIIFLPVSAVEGRSGRAFIQPDGTYEATTINKGHGLMAGDYRVSVVPAPFNDEHAQEETSRGGRTHKVSASSKAYRNFPGRYRNPATSGLTLAVDASESRVKFDVDLANK